MSLLTKQQQTKLQKQYSKGSDFNQKVIAKIFNPTGAGTWYLINQNPDDPDYLWCVADLGMGHEMGSVLLSELESIRGIFDIPLERDKWFDEMTVKELYKKLDEGIHV